MAEEIPIHAKSSGIRAVVMSSMGHGAAEERLLAGPSIRQNASRLADRRSAGHRQGNACLPFCALSLQNRPAERSGSLDSCRRRPRFRIGSRPVPIPTVRCRARLRSKEQAASKVKSPSMTRGALPAFSLERRAPAAGALPSSTPPTISTTELANALPQDHRGTTVAVGGFCWSAIVRGRFFRTIRSRCLELAS